ncbi:hypothetical protein DFP94_10532 [Fontibacillus phaseoli]|uniref:Phosphoglycerol transferase n=1 Tax=Fontibacillus phaseoli TaxID=1416533 RepID=A0A369BEM6_9BACL|nr:hypothetical protein [Fontibacillus phaseoli]RCX19016.1 hypothetical protein DFP94_10532 [Fontibacillus phaseoli]
MIKQTKKNIGYIIVSVLLSIIFTFSILKLWNADLSVPFSYSGDSLLTGLMIKSIINNGWYLSNNFVGAPFGLEFYDFTMFDNFFLFLIKILSLFTSHYALIFNLYFLLTFPLTAALSFYVFKKMNFSAFISLIGSQLFTFVPYHFLRGQPHLFLASYFFVPIIVLILYKVYASEVNFYQINNRKLKLNINKANFLLVLFCLVFSSCGIYYTFFSCFFLSIIGISAWINKKKTRNLINALIIIAILLVGSLINIAPNIVYKIGNGNNIAVANRSYVESEVYGLKISQLLLPVTSHRISYLEQLKASYNSHSPLVNENDFSSLGILGSIGFVISLILLFLRNRFRSNKLPLFFSEMNISALLLATIGGFGTLFAMIILPEIRAYNRISIFISFFSISMFLIVADILKGKIKKNGYRYSYNILLFLIMVFGLLDQTTSSMVPNYSSTKQEFDSDKSFVERIEKSLPTGALVFQFPYVPFPENPPVNFMGDYELLKGYMHSDSLRWSYGAMKGRKADLWIKNVASTSSTNEIIEKLSFSGFSGIYVDRRGYGDNANLIANEIQKILQTTPIESDNKRLLFYDMNNYNQRLKSKFSTQEWNEKANDTLHPLLISWSTGFYDMEQSGNNYWRWSSSVGELDINNFSDTSKKLRLEGVISTGSSIKSDLYIKSELINNEIELNSSGQFINYELVVPPGKFTIKFMSNADRIVNSDPRELVFKISDYKIVEIKID